MAYRVPRRFILPPDDPPPYGFLALSLAGHVGCLFAAMVVSAFLSAQIDQSKVYIVNLVPTPPAGGSPATRIAAQPTPATPSPQPAKAPERTPPKPEPPREPPKPKAEPPRESPPPRPERAPTPPPPPRTPPREVARATARPDEFALPRKVEKDTPALDTQATRERLLERVAPPPPPRPVTPPPPATPPPARAPEPPRVAAPQAPPPAPPAAAAVARPGVEPMRLGRPDAAAPTTGSISLDVADFPFTYYLRQVQAKISERWTPPRATAAGSERAIILFEIGRDGTIREPKVERESGNALYDQSALRAVIEASPFPPLPPEFKAPSLRVHFGFEFRPEQG